MIACEGAFVKPMSSSIRMLAQRCCDAAQVLAHTTRAQRQALIERMAEALLTHQQAILDANGEDLAAAHARQRSPALIDRLRLTPQRLGAIASALQTIACLPDPLGAVTQTRERPNGIQIEKVRMPLGVIAMIYEARPNVTADAAALCLKAGNGVILRGGSDALCSNRAIASCLQRVLEAAKLPPAVLTLIEDQRHASIVDLVQLTGLVDLVIPRGGEGLIRFVSEHARVPVIKHYKGVCHQYVDASADIACAVRLLIDGKVSRPSACNALETVLVHAAIADRFVPEAIAALHAHQVEIRGDAAACARFPALVAATEEDYAAEYLDLIISLRIVPDLDAAIAHIQRYGTDHTEVIVTDNQHAAMRFITALRSAVVMVNTSSRFSDGGEMGLGAEIGISTTRLHAYGPMGLEALTIERFVVRGNGQVRHPELFLPSR